MNLRLSTSLKFIFKKIKMFRPKKVRIPTPLRKLTNNEELVEVNAATIGRGDSQLDGQ